VPEGKALTTAVGTAAPVGTAAAVGAPDLTTEAQPVTATQSAAAIGA
jgi:hypothetical protein